MRTRANRARGISRRTAFWIGLGASVLFCASARAFEPSPTSPYVFGPFFPPVSQDRVGDGNFHDLVSCNQSGAPLYFCPNTGCNIGWYGTGQATGPILHEVSRTVVGQTETVTLDIEYFVWNAYCNPPADGGDIHQPNAVSFYVELFSIDENGTVSLPLFDFDPYWEHGSVRTTLSLTGCPARFLQARYVYAVTTTDIREARSRYLGPYGRDANGLVCVPDLHICPPPAPGKPINPGSGNERYSETLFSVAQNVSPLTFALSYNSLSTVATSLGVGFTHTFAQTMKLSFATSTRIVTWINERGEKTLYRSPNPGVDPFLPLWPGDATGSVTLDTGAGTYVLTDIHGTVTTFGSTLGEWRSTTDRWGNTVSGTYTSGNLTSFSDPEGRAWVLGYAGSQLTSITDPDGHPWSFSYDGSGQLQTVRDPFHVSGNPWRTYTYVTVTSREFLAQIQDDALAVLEAHEYDATGRATSSWSGDTVVTSGVPHPGANARDLVTLTYDSTTQTTATSKIDATTNQVSTFTYIYPVGRVLPTSIIGNCASCGGGGDQEAYTYDAFNHPLTKVVGSGTEQSETDSTYDANGMVLTRTEPVGKPEARTTTFIYGYVSPTGVAWPAFVTSMTEPSAAKSGQNKVTTYSWNTSGTPETTLSTQVSGFLKSTDASPTIYTTTSLFDTKHRPTEVDGPATNQKTTLLYFGDLDGTLDRRGRLQQSSVYTSATAHLDTTFDSYDIFGTAKKVVDPNGVETDRTTDAKGRVLTVVSKMPPSDPNEPADYTTTYTFDTRDRLIDAILPVGNKIRYQYEDGTNRLLDTIQVDLTGKQQARLHLTLNVIGGKTKEEAQSCTTPAVSCAAWATKRNESFKYDVHNRLSEVDHPTPIGSKILYTYDSRGDLTGVQDERHTAANAIYAYDFLNRLTTVTQKQTIVSGPDVITQYGYDVHDNLTSVTDPNVNLTSYAYDDFRRVQTQTSPVSGATSYSYDPAGNVLTSKDGNNATTTRVYDAANRVTSAISTRTNFTTETVTYTYDDPTAGNYGLGRLSSMSDPVGSTTYAYERRGLLRSEVKTISATAFTSTYAYDTNGNRKTVTYPSARSIAYTFDFADRPKTAKQGTTTYVSSATYAPFGPETKIVYGNGTTKTVTVDQRYRIKTNKLTTSTATLASYSYTLDTLGNITQIADLVDATFNRDFAYDDLNRLTTANSGASLWGTATGNGYTYDKMGNVLSVTLGTSRTATFVYSGTLPKLTSVTETGLGTRTVTYDAAGNEKKIGTGTQTYSSRNFLKTADALTYAYDGRGLRTSVTQGTNKRYFFYSPEMNLLEETTLAATPTAAGGYDEIWFNGHPVAEEDGGTHWAFTDHLGTPTLQTDSIATVFWRAEHEPYGRVFTLRGLTNQHAPLRLPGQEAEELNVSTDGNGSTERFYNVFRWYRPRWGRYTQGDPVGIRSGTGPDTNLFSYVLDNPLAYTDPLGLAAEVCCRPVTGTGSKHCFIRIDGHTYSLFPESFPCGGRGIPKLDADADIHRKPTENCSICRPKPCPQIDGTHRQCFDYASATYPIADYKCYGPNSNTYAAYMANTCCEGGFPQGMGPTPGHDSPLPKALPIRPR